MGQYQKKQIPFFEIPVKNYGGSDIAAGSGLIADTTTANVDGVVVPTAAGSIAGQMGINRSVIPAGQYGAITVYGVAVGTSYGAIERGQKVRVSSTASHLGQIVACAAGEACLGTSLDKVADAEEVRVLLAVGNVADA